MPKMIYFIGVELCYNLIMINYENVSVTGTISVEENQFKVILKFSHSLNFSLSQSLN